jgi:hypothetical protein
MAISRFLKCLRRGSKHVDADGNSEQVPTFGPLPLVTVNTPNVFPNNPSILAHQGWATVTHNTSTDELYHSSQALFQATKAFFDLTTDYKQTLKTQHGSEEGWCCINGEKEFITLRSLDDTPEELKDASSTFWAETGELLNELLGCIAESLGLPAEALTIYSKPCIELGHDKCATMLRLFKYEGCEGHQAKIVAERMFECFLVIVSSNATTSSGFYPFPISFLSRQLMLRMQHTVTLAFSAS